MRIRVNAPPVRVSMDPPPLRKKKHGSPCECPPPPPLSKEEIRLGPLTWEVVVVS